MMKFLLRDDKAQADIALGVIAFIILFIAGLYVMVNITFWGFLCIVGGVIILAIVVYNHGK